MADSQGNKAYLPNLSERGKDDRFQPLAEQIDFASWLAELDASQKKAKNAGEAAYTGISIP